MAAIFLAQAEAAHLAATSAASKCLVTVEGPAERGSDLRTNGVSVRCL